jgi:hypothetical protein
MLNPTRRLLDNLDTVLDAAAELRSLREQVATMIAHTETEIESHNECDRGLEAAWLQNRTLVTALKASKTALEKYGAHLITCAHFDKEPGPCTCGLLQACKADFLGLLQAYKADLLALASRR